jgi:hypothetical protein
VSPILVGGALAPALAAAAAASLVARRAAPWALALLTLSPIQALALREAAPEALLVAALSLLLVLAGLVERRGGSGLAAALGLVGGGLAASGVAAFVATGLLVVAFPASRPGGRRAGVVAACAALGAVALALALGVARSPLDYGPAAALTPATTAAGILRCAGASFTRVIGIEYHLVVSHARYALPLTALFLTLMVRGASRLPPRTRALLVAGAVLPVALGAALALVTGHVAPLQASRLTAALPFVVLLTAGGLASLRGWRAVAGGVLVLGALAGFLALALRR